MNALRATLATAIAATCLLTLPSLGGMASANASVQKCIGKNGSVTYTDGACSAASSPVALPMHVAKVIARENATNLEYDADGAAGAPIGLGPRNGTAGCARSPQQLQADLGYAFASRDVNRMSESYHWLGLNHKDAKGILSRLESMSRDRVASSNLMQIGPASAFATPVEAKGAPVGYLQLALANGSPVQMQVTEVRGCYFARF